MIDFTNVIDIMLGQNQVTQIEDSLGNVLWSATPPAPTPTEYFYVEDISGSANTLSIVKNMPEAPTIEVFYSTDQTNWTSMGTTDTTEITATVPANGKLYLKATANAWGSIDFDLCYNHIDTTGNCNVGGNINSLLYGSSFNGQTEFPSGVGIYAFGYLFSENSNIIGASELLLPATTLVESCYNSMFSYCTSLTTAPTTLPATTLANECYSSMFDSCTSLTTAPATLPATTLADYCYSYMFGDCTSLTTAPALPATTLADYCYNGMFYGCTGLTTAPILPATTLATECYGRMFDGCTSLTTAPALPATTLADSCYSGMFEDCTSLTTAPALPATTLVNGCYSSMFNGCSSLTSAPALPATTLAQWCYHYMFGGCTGLTSAPALPATTLVNGCYQYMFNGCTGLNEVTTYANDISATGCVSLWLNNVAAQGDFYNLGGATYESGADGIPTGWTEHTSL